MSDSEMTRITFDPAGPLDAVLPRVLAAIEDGKVVLLDAGGQQKVLVVDEIPRLTDIIDVRDFEPAEFMPLPEPDRKAWQSPYGPPKR